MGGPVHSSPAPALIQSQLFLKGFPREKVKELCNLDAPIPETDKLRSRDKEYVQSIREGYRRRRVVSKLKLQFPMSILETEEEQSLDETRARLAALWNQQPVEVQLLNGNLPPMINHNAVDPNLKHILNPVIDIAGNLGGMCFIVGSFSFYEKYNKPTLGAVLFAVGSLLFFTGSVASFIKNDAWSGRDVALSINAWLYLFANFLFILGSIGFVPAVAAALKGMYVGLSLFIIGSAILVFAPTYDMYRAWKLRHSVQISCLNFIVESTIAVLYIAGASAFMLGCVYFFPALYDEFAVTMFVVGSCFFFAATISSPLANLWRYLNRKSIEKLQCETTEEIMWRELRNVGDKGYIRKKRARSMLTHEICAATDYVLWAVGSLISSSARSAQKLHEQFPANDSDIELGMERKFVEVTSSHSTEDELQPHSIDPERRHSDDFYFVSIGGNRQHYTNNNYYYYSGGGVKKKKDSIAIVFRTVLSCDVDIVDST